MTIENSTLLNRLGDSIAVELLPNHSSSIEHSGLYWLDAVVFHQTGQIELGLIDASGDYLGYFELNRDISLGGVCNG